MNDILISITENLLKIGIWIRDNVNQEIYPNVYIFGGVLCILFLIYSIFKISVLQRPYSLIELIARLSIVFFLFATVNVDKISKYVQSINEEVFGNVKKRLISDYNHNFDNYYKFTYTVSIEDLIESNTKEIPVLDLFSKKLVEQTEDLKKLKLKVTKEELKKEIEKYENEINLEKQKIENRKKEIERRNQNFWQSIKDGTFLPQILSFLFGFGKTFYHFAHLFTVYLSFALVLCIHLLFPIELSFIIDKDRQEHLNFFKFSFIIVFIYPFFLSILEIFIFLFGNHIFHSYLLPSFSLEYKNNAFYLVANHDALLSYYLILAHVTLYILFFYICSVMMFLSPFLCYRIVNGQILEGILQAITSIANQALSLFASFAVEYATSSLGLGAKIASANLSLTLAKNQALMNAIEEATQTRIYERDKILESLINKIKNLEEIYQTQNEAFLGLSNAYNSTLSQMELQKRQALMQNAQSVLQYMLDVMQAMNIASQTLAMLKQKQAIGEPLGTSFFNILFENQASSIPESTRKILTGIENNSQILKTNDLALLEKGLIQYFSVLINESLNNFYNSIGMQYQPITARTDNFIQFVNQIRNEFETRGNSIIEAIEREVSYNINFKDLETSNAMIRAMNNTINRIGINKIREMHNRLYNYKPLQQLWNSDNVLGMNIIRKTMNYDFFIRFLTYSSLIESGFNANAISSAGALSYQQIMPKTLKFLMNLKGREILINDKLAREISNIVEQHSGQDIIAQLSKLKLGFEEQSFLAALYYAYCAYELNKQKILVNPQRLIASYNAGPGGFASVVRQNPLANYKPSRNDENKNHVFKLNACLQILEPKLSNSIKIETNKIKQAFTQQIAKTISTTETAIKNIENQKEFDFNFKNKKIENTLKTDINLQIDNVTNTFHNIHLDIDKKQTQLVINTEGQKINQKIENLLQNKLLQQQTKNELTFQKNITELALDVQMETSRLQIQNELYKFKLNSWLINQRFQNELERINLQYQTNLSISIQEILRNFYKEVFDKLDETIETQIEKIQRSARL
ncbi:MAG: hypothetical protein N2505_00115 [Endomicrobia bacterium]|nr:hypothetical protein [Endomicrobiia bacterium]